MHLKVLHCRDERCCGQFFFFFSFSHFSPFLGKPIGYHASAHVSYIIKRSMRTVFLKYRTSKKKSRNILLLQHFLRRIHAESILQSSEPTRTDNAVERCRHMDMVLHAHLESGNSVRCWFETAAQCIGQCWACVKNHAFGFQQCYWF